MYSHAESQSQSHIRSAYVMNRQENTMNQTGTPCSNNFAQEQFGWSADWEQWKHFVLPHHYNSSNQLEDLINSGAEVSMGSRLNNSNTYGFPLNNTNYSGSTLNGATGLRYDPNQSAFVPYIGVNQGQPQRVYQIPILVNNFLKRPAGFMSLRLTQGRSTPLEMALYPWNDVRKMTAPPGIFKKKKPTTMVKKVHERRKMSMEFRRKQFEQRRRAEKERQFGQAHAIQIQNAKIREAALVRKLKREARKKRKPPNNTNCPLDTCPKRWNKDKFGSPSSVLTHISQDSGRRSRSPIRFGSGSNC